MFPWNADYIKQHLSNIWGSIHQKAKSNTDAKLKKRCLQKTCNRLSEYVAK